MYEYKWCILVGKGENNILRENIIRPNDGTSDGTSDGRKKKVTWVDVVNGKQNDDHEGQPLISFYSNNPNCNIELYKSCKFKLLRATHNEQASRLRVSAVDGGFWFLTINDDETP